MTTPNQRTPQEIAAEKMDWQQVVLNGGPPCFNLCETGRFCGRAKRWAGHEDNSHHTFVSLDQLLVNTIQSERDRAEKAEELRDINARSAEFAIRRAEKAEQQLAEAKRLLEPLARHADVVDAHELNRKDQDIVSSYTTNKITLGHCRAAREFLDRTKTV